MSNVLYFDSVTNIAQSGGFIQTSTSAVTQRAILEGSISDIGLASDNKMAIDIGGTFSKYATIKDQLTDIPLTATGQVIDPYRVNKWFYGVGYGRIWTPPDMPSTELWGWWDSSDSDNVPHAANFSSQINDKSIYRRHFTSDTGSEYPKYGSRKINNRLVLTFDGVDDYFKHANYIWPASGNVNIFYVAIVDTHSGAGSSSVLALNNASNNFQMDAGSTTEWRHTADLNDVGADIQGTTDLLGQLVLIHVEYNWDTKIITRYVNGVQDGTPTAYLAKFLTGELRMARNRGAAYANCAFGEVIITDGNTYNSDITTYLMNKWGLS
jgi:hypothetical protein